MWLFRTRTIRPPFPPPALPGFNGTTTDSDFLRVIRGAVLALAFAYPSTLLEGNPQDLPGCDIHPLPTCGAQDPGGPILLWPCELNR